MDNYSQGLMIGIGISFLILPTIAVGARLWAKLLCRKGIRLDDYLIIMALVITGPLPGSHNYSHPLDTFDRLLYYRARSRD